jgi:hypothetical protein
MASVAQPIPEHYRRAFQDNFDHVVQQEIQKLGTRVKVDNFTGKEKVYTDMEQFEFVRRNGRLTNSSPDEVEAHNRKLVKVDFKCQKIFDRLDDEFLGSLGRPDSEVLQGMRMAWNRTVDREVAAASIATVYGGAESYVTPIDLPSGQKVAVNYVRSGSPANSNLTPAKILRAIAILEANEVYPSEEECCIAISPQNKFALMNFVETSPNDVWAKMVSAWLDGTNKKLFELDVVLTNSLVSASNISSVFVWSKRRGINVAPDRLETHIDVRTDKDHAVQISAYGLYGFMRRYEKTVVEIKTDDTLG